MKKNSQQFLLYFFSFLFLVLIFVLHGSNVWGEIIVEYMPYAHGAQSLEGSFAGYLTIFPILIAKIYFYIFHGTCISWPTFASIVSFVYTYLCIFIIIKICLKKNMGKKTVLILMPLYILLIHPSVSNFINITHLGYLPMILYIILSINDLDFSESMLSVPYYTFIPLIISIISKPSLSFIPFILILCLTKMYKSPFRFGIFLVSILVTGFQTLLYRTAATSLIISSFKGILNYIFVLFQSFGASLTFSFTFYTMNWNEYKLFFLIVISILLGIVIVCICFFVLQRKRNFLDFVKRFLLLASIGFIGIFPFTTVNCNLDLSEVLKANITNVFSKYKLQYQLTACFIVLTILLVIINTIKNKKIKNCLLAFIFIGTINGLLVSLYAAHWPSVNSFNTISYNQTEAFLYAPYAEWDYNWNIEANGWYWGNTLISKFKKINMNDAIYFDDLNNQLFMAKGASFKGANMYLFWIDREINLKSETNYIEYLTKSNKKKQININYDDNKEITVMFSIASYNNIRYAYLEYDEDLYNALVNNNFKFKGIDTFNENDLNVVLISF